MLAIFRDLYLLLIMFAVYVTLTVTFRDVNGLR